MLENYLSKPKIIDRIRQSWIAESIDKYVSWLQESQEDLAKLEADRSI